MNRINVCVGCVLFALGGQVAAQCSTGRVTGGNTLRTFLQNKTVCGTGVGANAGQQWQEWHQGAGFAASTLTEYAKGPSDPVDPTHDVGTWLATGGTNSLVTYTYTGSATAYTWALFNDGGGNYSYCTAPGGTVVATATFLTGQASCGF